MLKFQEIQEIIKLIDESSIEKFTYKLEDAKIIVEKGNSNQVVSPIQEQVVQAVPVTSPAPVAPPVQEANTIAATEAAPSPQESVATEKDESIHEIVSPMVGTFYQASSPEADAYVKVGDKVSEDAIVCIVEAMKLFNEIEAEVTGEIVEILVKDGQLVEYGQPLFLVKTN